MTDEPFNAPESPQPAPPQIVPMLDRDATGAPCVVLLCGVAACQTRLQVDPNGAAILGRALLQLSRDAQAQLIVPNQNGKPLTP